MKFPESWITGLRLLVNTPRILLFFLAILVKLVASLLSGLGFAIDSPGCYLAGTMVWITWFFMLWMVIRPDIDVVLKSSLRWLKPMAIVTITGLLLFGLIQAVVMPVAGLNALHTGGKQPAVDDALQTFERVFAYNDATALTHQAAENLNSGLNPYSESNIVRAMLDFDGSYDKLTPLRTGFFKDDFPYPSESEIEQRWRQVAETPEVIPEDIVSVYGYPAASFIIPAPFTAMGISDIRWVFFILAALAVIGIVWVAPAAGRLVIVLAVLVSLELGNSLMAGETGYLYFPFLLLGWALVYKRWRLSAVFMGIAIAVKQVAWFLAPFYMILVWHRYGWSKLWRVAAINFAVFLAFNLPFIIIDGPLWLRSLASPMLDELFPLGVGIITLVTGGFWHFDNPVLFTVLEFTIWITGIVWYYFKGRKYPLAGPVLGVLPLFFAWRSLWPYFFYIDIIVISAMVLWYCSRDQIVTAEIERI